MYTNLIQVLTLAPMVLAGTIQYPEIVPGPGLPSLEELGLTSEMLWKMGTPEPADAPALSRRFTGRCGPSEQDYTNVDGLIGCYHYLHHLDTRQCEAPGGGNSVEFCYTGDAHVTGYSLSRGTSSSYCRDVAAGLLWSIDHCTRSDQSCAGAQAARGNGNLIVFGSRK